jgi:hypothetical protein
LWKITDAFFPLEVIILGVALEILAGGGAQVLTALICTPWRLFPWWFPSASPPGRL